MRNITGSPAEGDDFFDRKRDLERFLRELANDASLLLIAPRRVGKTSFVLRLCETWRSRDLPATFFNVEGCHDEIDFAQSLIDSLRDAGLEPNWLPKLSDAFRRGRRALSGIRVGVGVDVELGGIPDLDHTTLSKLLESILERIEKSEKTVLVVVDELPELLLAISRADQGHERVARFLHWMRAVRQTYRRHVRWLFLGSIGLDTFVDDRNLRKTIIDLTAVTLGAFDSHDAHTFLEKLGRDNQLPLNEQTRAAILERAGWALPYHLQLVFHAFVDLGLSEVTAADVDRAVEHLLRPENAGLFDTWRQRLHDQFDKPVTDAALGILKFLCQHPTGRTRSQILDALMAANPQADVDQVERRLATLLVVLQRDGYLFAEDGRYGFRSFLLREYWFRREVR